jgi:hypothetical protein
LRQNLCPDHFGNARGRGFGFEIVGDVQIGLIKAERLHKRRPAGEDGPDLVGDSAIDLKPVRHKNQLWAKLPRPPARHGRAHAKFARFIAGGCHNAPLATAAHGNRLAPQLGKIALLDRCEKRIHIDMDNLAGLALFHIRSV